MRYLIVVDVQKDFVDGALGTKEAVEMLPNLVKKVKNYEGEVWFTKDTHPDNYLQTQEGRILPVQHCVKGTDGWKLAKELEKVCDMKKAVIYEKPTFGSTQMAEDLKKLYDKGEVESVELVGICTDICVVSNALLLKAFMPELPIYVDAKCCAGVTIKKHEAALEVMESCQILVDR